MEHPGESLPGWSLGYTREEGGFPYAKLETESGRFTAVWYETRRATVYFRRAAYTFCLDPDSPRIKLQRVLSPSVFVATCPASEVVGQCLLFDTGG
jgi:hypothetical protein